MLGWGRALMFEWRTVSLLFPDLWLEFSAAFDVNQGSEPVSQQGLGLHHPKKGQGFKPPSWMGVGALQASPNAICIDFCPKIMVEIDLLFKQIVSAPMKRQLAGPSPRASSLLWQLGPWSLWLLDD